MLLAPAFIGETMRKIRLEQLTSGMRLAQDVVNFSGQVLLYKGNPLQPKDIKILKLGVLSRLQSKVLHQTLPTH